MPVTRKRKRSKTLDDLGVVYEDMGTYSCDSVDYPDYATQGRRGRRRRRRRSGPACLRLRDRYGDRGKQVPGVRAAVAWNEEIARLAREHNNANVLSLAARFTPPAEMDKIVRSWFGAPLTGGRHERRVEKIEQIEKEETAEAAGSS